MESNKVVSDWKFSFREFFRMAVPGLSLLVIGSPVFSPFLWGSVRLDGNSLEVASKPYTVIAALLFGLVWFSAQMPKKISLYRRRVALLKKLMLEGIPDTDIIDKPAYQYLIECVIPSLASQRVHYFASYYYMLMDVALVSLLFAVLNSVSAIVRFMISYDTLNGMWWNVEAYILGYGLMACAPILLVCLGIMCWRSSVYFLDDVMQFSIFVVEAHKKEAHKLSIISGKSEILREYNRRFVRHRRR